VTAFTKKLKNIGTVSASQFLPDLDRYNLSKYLDEIATNICEAKVKTSYLGSLVEFCVKMASLYKDFPAHLVQEFRKQMPTKKSDKIENPSKLRVDLRLFYK
jgi:regulator of nonsense transcripts 2